MKINVSGDPALEGLLGYDPASTQNMTQSAAAQDTSLTVNGIAVSSKTKTVNEALQGVTLNVNKIGDAVINVANDTQSVETAVNAFVKSYNELNSTIKSLTSYDPETKKGGLLLGDRSVQEIQSQVRSMLGTPIANSQSTFRNFTQIGISFDKAGTMTLESAKLKKASEENFKDIAPLFASSLTASDSLISFVSSTSATKPGKNEIFISSLATKGSLTGAAPPTTMSIVANDNDKLVIKVDGVEAEVTLEPGDYSSSTLAAHLQTIINGASALSTAGISVTVNSDADGILSITSNRYGSASTIGFSGGSGVTNLFGASSATAGTDVAGTINGTVAVGSGQHLTGATGTMAEGLKLLISGGAAPAARGTADFSQGYAYQLGKLVEGFVSSSGLIAGQTDGINKIIKDFDRSRDAISTRLEQVEKRYRAQFTALDVALANMTQTSNYLAQQLANLPTMG